MPLRVRWVSDVMSDSHRCHWTRSACFSSRPSPKCRAMSLSIDADRVCSMLERNVIMRCTSISWQTRLKKVYVTITSVQRTMPSGSLLARAVHHLHSWYTRSTAPVVILQKTSCAVSTSTSSLLSTFILQWIVLASPCSLVSVVRIMPFKILEEIRHAIAKLKCDRASGWDNITPEMCL